MWIACLVVTIAAIAILSESVEQTVGFRKVEDMFNPKLFPYLTGILRLMDCASMCAQQACAYFEYSEATLKCDLYAQYVSYKGYVSGTIYLNDIDEKPPCPSASSCLPNIAFGKPVTMSTYFEGLSAQLAVDGDLSPAWPYCAHSEYELTDPWLLLDLQQPYKVSNILIIKRSNCCLDRLANIVVSMGPNSASLQTVYYYEGWDNDPTHAMRFIPAITAEFVKISLNGTGERLLEICELFVFGEP